jgi:peptidoglycan/xylan/chitin deacetylase (PgdA/CDA1 family)
MFDPKDILAATALAAVSGAAVHGTFSPTSSFWGTVTWRAAGAGNCVALTFDDGPTAGCSERVLDILDELQVPAAFFVIGASAARRPDIIRRIDAAGHLLGNHTYDHDHLGILRGPIYWNDQLRRTDEMLAGIIGRKPALFRPSMGFTTWPIHHAARRGEQAVVTWSIRGRDGLGGESSQILRRMVEPARGGDILMLHDGIDPHLLGSRIPDRNATITALPRLIAALREKGLQIVRLDQLLGIDGYARDSDLRSAPAQAERGAGNHIG